MVVTEEEAGQLICPIADYMRIQGHECRASGCMAWRWVEGSKVAFNPSRVHAGGLFDAPKEQWRGYCGLAGKPMGGC